MSTSAATIYYSSPVGMLRIRAEGPCITELHFCNDKEDVQKEAAGEATGVLQQCVNELMEYFQGQRRVFDIPVQQEGTVFRQRVWGELLNIPYGKTISYLTLAHRLGDPKVSYAGAPPR
jgi:methylated-DNA-[protein]-cysteine S-methyltransferase